MAQIMRMNDRETRMLCASDVRERTGLSREAALAVVKRCGVRIGRRYYITPARLEDAINGRLIGSRIG